MWKDFDGKEDVKLLTFTNLLRVIKNQHLFPRFRSSLAMTPNSGENGVSSIYWRIPCFNSYRTRSMKCIEGDDSTLHYCWDYKTLLQNIESAMGNPRFDRSDKDAVIQFYVTELINAFLHNFLERVVSHDEMKMLEQIGQETFNMTCNKLFGEGFEDKTPKAPIHDFAFKDLEKTIDTEYIAEMCRKIQEKMDFGGVEINPSDFLRPYFEETRRLENLGYYNNGMASSAATTAYSANFTIDTDDDWHF